MPPKGEENAKASEAAARRRASFQSLLDEEEPDDVSITTRKVQRIKFFKYLRIVILSLLWLAFTIIMLMTEEKYDHWKGISVPISADGKIYQIKEKPDQDSLQLLLRGPFTYKYTDMIGRKIGPQFLQDESGPFIEAFVMQRKENNKFEVISKTWHISLLNSKDFEKYKINIRKNEFKLTDQRGDGEYFYKFILKNAYEPVAILVQSYQSSIPTTTSIIISALVMIGLYTMLFWDITSRSIIAVLFCTLSVALMGLYHLRPMLPDIPKFVDMDYILLIIGLTIIVGLFAETGGDLYLAVQVFRLSRGHIWPLLTVILIITAVFSALLDRLTIIVIVTLFVIRYCEIQQLNAGNVLTCIMLFSNIGNMLLPSVLVRNAVLRNPDIIRHAQTLDKFWNYVLHMFIPVVLAAIMTYIFLRLFFHSTKSMQIVEAPVVTRLKHAIRLWSHTAKSLGEYSEVEKAVQQNVRNKVDRLRARLKRLGKMPIPAEDFNAQLERLQKQHSLKKKWKVLTCAVILSLVLLVHMGYFVGWHYMSTGWTCLLFSLILLALFNWHDFESLMTKMDWSTILLVACIMIITRALAILGLIDVMGDSVIEIICRIDKASRLQWGVIILICVSAFAAAFFDNSYVCYSLASKVVDLINSSDTPLPFEPLLMSVMLGAGFGSNATLISSFGNILCSGLNEKHDFKLYFWDYFKVGSIVTLFGVIISIIYVLLYVVTFY